MNIDARTKETAATLLGVAFKRKEPSDPNPAMSDALRSTWSSNGGSPPIAAPKHGVPQTSTASVVVSKSIPRGTPPKPFSTAVAAPFPPPQSHGSRPQHAHSHSRPSMPMTRQPPISPHPSHQASSDTNTVLSMSSIGFGIDSSAPASWGDATEAATRALQDAMERSTLRLPMTMPAQHLLQIKVQLGVPAKKLGSTEPMIVDVSRLTAILPKSIPVLPIQVVVGGLFLPGETQGSPSICTAVACIILQSQAPLSMSEKPVARSHPSMAAQAPNSSPWASLEVHQSSKSPPIPLPSPQPHTSVNRDALAVKNSIPAPMPPTIPVSFSVKKNISVADSPSAHQPPRKKVHQNTSIEMLAMISEEIRLAADNNRCGHTLAALPRADEAMSNDESLILDELQMRNGNYNYKKLPPGITTKNNRRLFVKHTYRDHSSEKPQAEEQDLVGSSNTRTPNAAFPLKLHETLTQIENDKHGGIIGWMPHGRSFKIHNQKSFAEIVLPRYFVMTKKSSFLRQLNLYGFNRFSAGPDQGSYYHEKFLRGMKFLCRRMTRQKVNGNRIRSAGNPDEEPVLKNYPSCPPPVISTSNRIISSMPPNKRLSYVSREDGVSDDDHGNHKNEVEEEEEMSEAKSPQGTAGNLRNNGGGFVSFPLKVQRLLDKLEADRTTDIIAWLSHGRAFIVHNHDAFVEHLMPVYFNQTKYSSFQRQLHMYNFQRITAGQDKGAYHHPHFQRGRPQLCAKMVRTKVNGKGCRKPGNPNTEPDLYSLVTLPFILPGTPIEVPYGNTLLDDEELDSNFNDKITN